eukprot:2092909-Rhodomonas_salina.2
MTRTSQRWHPAKHCCTPPRRSEPARRIHFRGLHKGSHQACSADRQPADLRSDSGPGSLLRHRSIVLASCRTAPTQARARAQVQECHGSGSQERSSAFRSCSESCDSHSCRRWGRHRDHRWGTRKFPAASLCRAYSVLGQHRRWGPLRRPRVPEHVVSAACQSVAAHSFRPRSPRQPETWKQCASSRLPPARVGPAALCPSPSLPCLAQPLGPSSLPVASCASRGRASQRAACAQPSSEGLGRP